MNKPKTKDGEISLQRIVETHVARLSALFDNTGVLLCGVREVDERAYDEFRRTRLPTQLAGSSAGFAFSLAGSQTWLAAHFLKDLLMIHAAYLEQARQFCLLVEASKLDLSEEKKKAWAIEAIQKRPPSLTEAIGFLADWTKQDIPQVGVLSDLEKFCAAYLNPATGVESLEIRLLRPKGATDAAKTATDVEIFTKRFSTAQRAALFPDLFPSLVFTAFVLCRDIAEAVKNGAALRTAEPAAGA